MGYYINTTSDGVWLPAEGKVQKLVEDGARIVEGDKFVEDMVCVVSNPGFEAAAYAYEEEEYESFKDTRNGADSRERVWLVYKHAKNLSGYTKRQQHEHEED